MNTDNADSDDMGLIRKSAEVSTAPRVMPEQSEQAAEKQLNDIVSSWMNNGELVQRGAAYGSGYGFLQKKATGEMKSTVQARAGTWMEKTADKKSNATSLISIELQRTRRTIPAPLIQTEIDTNDKPLSAIDLSTPESKQAASIIRDLLTDLDDPTAAAKRDQVKKEKFSIANMARANLKNVDLSVSSEQELDQYGMVKIASLLGGKGKVSQSSKAVALNERINKVSAATWELLEKAVASEKTVQSTEEKAQSESMLKQLLNYAEEGPIPRRTRDKVAKILEGILSRMQKSNVF